MSNINSNRLDVSLNPQEVTQINAAITNIEVLMPFLTGLTIEERVSIPKINVANKAFTEDAINIAVNNPSLFPGYIIPADMQKDLLLFGQLDVLATSLRRVLEKIEDTLMLAGSESYISALAVYRSISAAAKAGVPGADSLYDQLRARFAEQGGNNPIPPQPNP